MIEITNLNNVFFVVPCFTHTENAGTLRMVPLGINPIYTLYSGYLLGISDYIPFERAPTRGVKQLGSHHPKGFPTIFPMFYGFLYILATGKSPNYLRDHPS